MNLRKKTLAILDEIEGKDEFKFFTRKAQQGSAQQRYRWYNLTHRHQAGCAAAGSFQKCPGERKRSF